MRPQWTDYGTEADLAQGHIVPGGTTVYPRGSSDKVVLLVERTALANRICELEGQLAEARRQLSLQQELHDAVANEFSPCHYCSPKLEEVLSNARELWVLENGEP